MKRTLQILRFISIFMFVTILGGTYGRYSAGTAFFDTSESLSRAIQPSQIIGLLLCVAVFILTRFLEKKIFKNPNVPA